jgi:hypothetical protein
MNKEPIMLANIAISNRKFRPILLKSNFDPSKGIAVSKYSKFKYNFSPDPRDEGALSKLDMKMAKSKNFLSPRGLAPI